MDPQLQDDTFATTLDGIEELRRAHRDNDAESWSEWRMLVAKSIRSGDRLEKVVQGLERKVAERASAAVVGTLVEDVNKLKAAQARRKRFWRSVIGWSAGIVATLTAGAALTWVQRHWP